MEAGRELDALVAEKVMGQGPCDRWKPANFGSFAGPVLIKCCNHERGACYSTVINGPVGGVPRYSTDIAAAWQVVEKVGKYFQIHHDFKFPKYGWTASFDGDGEEADSAPLAICLAALKGCMRV